MPARTATTSIDPRSPFAVDTRELGRRAGSMRTLERDVAAPADWGLNLVTVPTGEPVHLRLRLESVMDGVLVSGEVSAPVMAECGRCLDPLRTTVQVPVQELFAYEPDPEDAELPVLTGDVIDLEPVLRDAVVLALPLNPICDENCAGLCPGCGVKRADVPDDHAHDDIDPRWEALARLHGGSSDTPEEN